MVELTNIVFCLNEDCTIRNNCLRVKPKGIALFKHWCGNYKQDENDNCIKFLDKTQYKIKAQ